MRKAKMGLFGAAAAIFFCLWWGVPFGNPCWAQSSEITEFHVAKKPDFSTSGLLYVTVNHKETKVGAATRALRLDKTRIAYMVSKPHEGDFYTNDLYIYDAATSASAVIMKNGDPVDHLVFLQTAPGKEVLLIAMVTDGKGAPTVAIADPKRGVVWRAASSSIFVTYSPKDVKVGFVRNDDLNEEHPFRSKPSTFKTFSFVDLLGRSAKP